MSFLSYISSLVVHLELLLHWLLISRNENEGENSTHSSYKHQYLRENVIRHAKYREENYKILVKTVKYE